jgi:hypothetical protein
MKTDARDIMRITETITLKGIWYDDVGQYTKSGLVGDGKTAYQRMTIVKLAAKDLRKSQYLLWKNLPFKVWFKDMKFDKDSGEGDAINYSITMVVVDK